MEVARRLLAVFLLAVALLVAVHFVFNSFYREALDTIDVWSILDWPIALGTLVALVVNFQRQRALSRDSDQAVSREFVAANVAAYTTLLLALWFFSNWFNFLNVGSEGETAANMVVWALADPLVVLVLGATGRNLWNDGLSQ